MARAWLNNKSHVNRNGLLTGAYSRESMARKSYWAVPKGFCRLVRKTFCVPKKLFL